MVRWGGGPVQRILDGPRGNGRFQGVWENSGLSGRVWKDQGRSNKDWYVPMEILFWSGRVSGSPGVSVSIKEYPRGPRKSGSG